MLLAELVDTSRAVAATSSRLAKRDLIADLLRQVPTDEIEIATAYLAGVLRQRRTGVGWRSLRDLPDPVAGATVTLAETDALMERLSLLAGEGSTTARRKMLDEFLARLTHAEQEHVRALVTGGLRQGAQDAVVLEAVAVAAGVPLAEVRRAAMFSALTGPVAAAALGGGVDELRGFTLEVGRPVRPMLASAAPDVAAAVEKVDSPRVVVDTKLDGIRIQVHKQGDQVLIFTRSLDEISERLPGVVGLTRSLAVDDAILDGEALMLGADGRPMAFQDTASSSARHDALESAVQPFFFDALLVDGDALIELPLTERLRRLDACVPQANRIPRLETDDPAEADVFFESAISAGQEGVIVKDPDAPYAAGRRGSAWIKVKPRHTLDLVVLAVEHGSGRRRGTLSNIHLGARDGDGFVMLGKTFKGMTDEMLAWQTERFRELEVADDGWVVAVRPEQVVEIAFDGVQRSTRYPGGVALRFARVVRYRDDKTPSEADTLEAVRSHLT
ncbi:MAG TPA: ATP-dependent DNA ligase [Marmoricola sp.]